MSGSVGAWSVCPVADEFVGAMTDEGQLARVGILGD
jgi:hypothetical protein